MLYICVQTKKSVKNVKLIKLKSSMISILSKQTTEVNGIFSSMDESFIEYMVLLRISMIV